MVGRCWGVRRSTASASPNSSPAAEASAFSVLSTWPRPVDRDLVEQSGTGTSSSLGQERFLPLPPAAIGRIVEDSPDDRLGG